MLLWNRSWFEGSLYLSDHHRLSTSSRVGLFLRRRAIFLAADSRLCSSRSLPSSEKRILERDHLRINGCKHCRVCDVIQVPPVWSGSKSQLHMGYHRVEFICGRINALSRLGGVVVHATIELHFTDTNLREVTDAQFLCRKCSCIPATFGWNVNAKGVQ